LVSVVAVWTIVFVLVSHRVTVTPASGAALNWNRTGDGVGLVRPGSWRLAPLQAVRPISAAIPRTSRLWFTIFPRRERAKSCAKPTMRARPHDRPIDTSLGSLTLALNCIRSNQAGPEQGVAEGVAGERRTSRGLNLRRGAGGRSRRAVTVDTTAKLRLSPSNPGKGVRR
jgi:hypothetical protein